MATIDTTLLRQELEQQLDVLAVWRRQQELHPKHQYTFTIAACETRIAELRARLAAVEKGDG